MPLEKGKIAVTAYHSGKQPLDILALLQADAARKLDDVKGDLTIGWTSGRHMLERVIDDKTSKVGDWTNLHIRTAVRKVPPALLKAECAAEEWAYMNSTGSEYVPKKVKREIKQHVIENRLKSVPPTITGAQVVIGKDITFVLTTSRAMCERVESLLGQYKLSLTQAGADHVFRKLKIKPTDYPGLLTGSEDDPCPERDFLLWLLWRCETVESSVTVNGDVYSIMLDGPMTLTRSTVGATTLALRGGSPTAGAEFKPAIGAGSRITKAKLIIAKDTQIWSAQFDAMNFTFSGMSMPENDEETRAGQFMARADDLTLFIEIVEELYKLFLSEACSDDWKVTEKAVKAWIKGDDE